MEILEEPPLVGKDKGPIQKEEVPPEKEGGKEEKKEEDALENNYELEHHEELKHKMEKLPQKEGVTKENIAIIESGKQ